MLKEGTELAFTLDTEMPAFTCVYHDETIEYCLMAGKAGVPTRTRRSP